MATFTLPPSHDNLRYQIAHSAGQDAGNRSMRKGRRSSWNKTDWNVATRAFNKVYAERNWGKPLAVNPRTGHAMRVQSLLFDRSTFTPAQARSWAHAHGYKYGDVEIPERGRYIHLRQLPPRGRVKRIIPIGSTLSGIRAIVLRNPLCCP